MTRRFSRHDAAPRRRWAVFSLAALAVLGACGWLAPTVLVLTSLRDRPLQAVFAGIDGSIASGSARWNWIAGIEFRDVILRDRAGAAVALVPRVVIDRGLALLAVSPRDLGTVRLVAPEVLVEVRAGGSSLEDILAPWLAGFASAPMVGTPRFDLEIVDGAVELVDRERHDAWRVSEVMGVGSVRHDATLAGWTVAGRVRHAVPTDTAVVPVAPPAPAAPPPDSSARLDRTTIAARATAVLARDGGWSVSSPEAADEGSARTMTVATHRVPLGVSSVLATRFAKRHVLDGLADVRLDVHVAAASARATGTLVLDEAALCAADTLAELVAVSRCELPLDLTVEEDRVVVRKLAATSPLFRGEASGTIRLPTGGSWDWAEDLVSEDFAIAADIDLAAVAQGMPGGLAVRPDVRLTGGTLELAAAAHGDGADRVLEARVAARNLAAVQGTAGPEAAERPLRWSEPLTGWVRGRRSSGRGARLTVEDARITSAALELSAAGTAEAATLQWTLDFDRLVADVNDVLDLEGVKLAGTSRGRIELAGGRRDEPPTVKATASLREFVWALPGRPAWRDKEVDLELEAAGRLAAGAAVVEAAHAVVTAAEDRLEATLTGGVIVDVVSAATGGVGPWVRPLPDAAGIAADCSLSGDLGRWHARAAGWLPPAGVDLELGGRIEASAAVAARGAAWQITRAGGEIEKCSVRLGDHTIAEPRLVATVAGVVDPSQGRIDVSSAEVLTATLSLRSGGVSWLPPPAGVAAQGMAVVLDRVRGRVQWQAEVGRLARWLPPAALADLAASGRAWGTFEIADVQQGANLLLEAVGSQLALARGDGPREIWSEPRAAVALEVTRPRGAAADAVMIERVAIESSTLAATARGSVSDWATRRLVALDGTVNWNWDQLSRLASPWTRGQVRLAGTGARPFAFRGPLGSLPQAAVAAADGVDMVPLPADWLAATRGRDPDEIERQARITRPATATVRPTDEVADRLRSLAIDTSLAWQAADVAGFAVAAGEMPVRLFEGQLALGPFDIGVAGGRVRGAPWLRLVGTPRELVVPPGRVIERVNIGGPHADAVVKLLSPLLGQRTQTEGLATVDLAGARLPLAAPLSGELAGQVILERFEVTPQASVQPLVNLLVKLQSAVDPRFAFGDKAVLLRVRPEPVRIRLAERRFWHEGLVMDAGQLVVKSQGSVGADGTLAMVVEVALRGDVVGNTPVIAQLVRTPLVIPLKGTVERPQFDARMLEMVMGRIVENTAEAVISDGLGRGLEALFGNPQPPASQQPLILPPR